MKMFWQRLCPICRTLLSKEDPCENSFCPQCQWVWGKSSPIFTGRVMAHLGQIWLEHYDISKLKLYDNKRIRIEFIEILNG